jgi:hypothetical protein
LNGKDTAINTKAGTYAELKRVWTTGDKIELILPMETKLMESNPLVEETRNQVAVKRGPVVYCMESIDLPKDKKLYDVALPADIRLQPKLMKIDHSDIMVLEGNAWQINDGGWEHQLYRSVSSSPLQPVKIRLVPYYSWGNRGHTNMEVWMPLSR